MGSEFTINPTYFNWINRRFEPIGSSNRAATISAETPITTRLAEINPSDTLNWTLWPITSNTPSDASAVDAFGYYWWNAETQRVEFTRDVNGYAEALPLAQQQQSWQLGRLWIDRFGETGLQSLQYFQPDGDTSSYIFQGDYARRAAPYLLDAAEWQALFAGGGDVLLPGLGLLVQQYGNGVTVTQAADGSFIVVSDASGGLTDIIPVYEIRQLYAGFPPEALDDLAIFEASQRSTTPLFETLETSATPEAAKTGEAENATSPTQGPPLANNVNGDTTPPAGVTPSSASANILGNAAGAAAPLQNPAANPLPLVDTAPITVSQSPQRALDAPAPEAQAQEEPPPTRRLADEAAANYQRLASVLESAVRESNTQVAPQRVPFVRQNEGFSITDDVTSNSEDRQRERRNNLSFTDKQEAREDMTKRFAGENTPAVRRLKAMQLQAYLNS